MIFFLVLLNIKRYLIYKKSNNYKIVWFRLNHMTTSTNKAKSCNIA